MQRGNYNVWLTHVQMDVAPLSSRIIRSTLRPEHEIRFRSRRHLASIERKRSIPLAHPASSRVAATIKSVRSWSCNAQFPSRVNCRSSTSNGPSAFEFVAPFGLSKSYLLGRFQRRGQVYHVPLFLRDTPFDRSHH